MRAAWPLFKIPRKLKNAIKFHSYPELFVLGGFLGSVHLPIVGIQVLIPFIFLKFLFSFSSKESFGRAGLKMGSFCWGYFVVSLYWISNSLFFEIEYFFWLVPFCFLGLPLFMAGIMAGAGYLIPWWREPGLRGLFWMILWWIGGETLLSFMAPQFPWPLLGYTWMAYPEIAQLGAFMGVYGLSALTLLFGFWAYIFVTQSKTKALFFVLLVGPTLLIVGLWNFGEERMMQPYASSTNIRLVQPNIPQVKIWDTQKQVRHLNTLIELSQTFNPSFFPQAVIWPESAINFYLKESPVLRDRLSALLVPGSYLISGVAHRSVEKEKIWNSIGVLDHQGTIRAMYDKHHLVPFGEYFPFRHALEKIFPKWTIRKVTAGLLDFSPGPGPVMLTMAPLPSFSPLVCYEIIFSGQVRTLGERPKWLLNLTNNIWFGDSAGPYQYLRMAQMRAVEEGLPVVVAANTGVSALIDPYGRILNSLGMNETGVIDCQIPDPLLPTVFSMFGSHQKQGLIWLLVFSSLWLWVLSPYLIIRKKFNDLWTKARKKA
jgi:apolipoprotein N-acyltransferase